MFFSRSKIYSVIMAAATLLFSQQMSAWAEPGTPAPKVVKSEDEWKKVLSPEQYRILRQKGTEAPYTGKYDKHFEKGSYSCAACGFLLFTSDKKFDSHCGWPAFFAVAAKDHVILLDDRSHGMHRVEVQCANCHGHLGHVFEDGPAPTGQRYCINSASIKFEPHK